MPAPVEGAERIRANGWRQGKLLCSADHSYLPDWLRDQIPEGARAIVVSQDCDLLHRSYDAERKVELVIASQVTESLDGNLTYGKNPRLLQFPIMDRSEELFFQCDASDRYFINRKILEDLCPDANLGVSSYARQILTRWLADRYRRAAFPDSFNLRVDQVRKKCEKRLRHSADSFTGIYVRLDLWDELAELESYKVMLFGVMSKRHFANDKKREIAQDTLEKVVSLLDSCKGVQIVEHGVVSEEDFSMHDLRQFRKWNLDYVSLESREISELPPD